jgi:flagellar hook-basal body complex protein FliE
MDKISGLPGQQYQELLRKIRTPGTEEKVDETSFKNVISKFINDVDQMQKRSDQAVKDYASGEITDIHQVMIAAEEANLSFQLMMEVRNRLLESYREIMRMQS